MRSLESRAFWSRASRSSFEMSSWWRGEGLEAGGENVGKLHWYGVAFKGREAPLPDPFFGAAGHGRMIKPRCGDSDILNSSRGCDGYLDIQSAFRFFPFAHGLVKTEFYGEAVIGDNIQNRLRG